MRRLDFVTAGLKLVLSVVIEISFFVVFRFLANGSSIGTPTNWLSWSFIWFHSPASFLDGCIETDTDIHWRIIVGTVTFFIVAVLEWWLIILAGTWLVRHFRRKSA